MTNGLIGRKLGMTRVFAEDGTAVPVTIIEAGPCRVMRTGDGRVQLGFGAQRASRASRAELGHAKAAGLEAAPAVVREFALAGDTPEAGAEVKVDIFAPGEMVKVTGTSKGRGFQGTIKRHGFNAGPRTHGSKNYREPGSTGNNTTPAHVIKGKRMPGHMGDARRTVRNLEVVKIEPEQNLLYVRGAVPGPRGGTVVVRKAKGSK